MSSEINGITDSNNGKDINNKGVSGKNPRVTSDKLLDSPSIISLYMLVNQREHLTRSLVT